MPWQPDYVTLAEAKAYVRIPDIDDDVQIALAITDASRAVDLSANRQFGLLAAVEARLYPAYWDRRRGRWIIEIDDLMTEVGLLVKADLDIDDVYTNTIDKFQLEPVNAAQKIEPWVQLLVKPDSANLPSSRVNALVQVTAKFGWTTVPTAIKQATLMQMSRFLARRDSPYGVAGSPDMGAEVRLLARLDPDVAVSVAPYRRWWGVA